MKNYYDILEVHPDSSQEVIEATYKALFKSYNPEKCDNQEDKIQAKRKISQIKEAYQILSNSKRKAKYDKYFKETAGHVETRKNPMEIILAFFAIALLIVIIGKFTGDLFFKYFAKLTVLVGDSPVLSIILLLIVMGTTIHFLWKNFRQK